VSLESCIACILAVDCFSSGANTVADNTFFASIPTGHGFPAIGVRSTVDGITLFDGDPVVQYIVY
jgi:hypothetical protein